MYRAVTLYLLNNNIDYNDLDAVAAALQQVSIHFERIHGQNHTFLNKLFKHFFVNKHVLHKYIVDIFVACTNKLFNNRFSLINCLIKSVHTNTII